MKRLGEGGDWLTVAQVVLFFAGLFAWATCSDMADAAVPKAEDVKRHEAEAALKHVEEPPEPLAPVEINSDGDVMVRHLGTWAVSYRWGDKVPPELANADPRCQRSFAVWASRLKRGQGLTIVCFPDDAVVRAIQQGE